MRPPDSEKDKCHDRQERDHPDRHIAHCRHRRIGDIGGTRLGLELRNEREQKNQSDERDDHPVDQLVQHRQAPFLKN